MLHKNHRKMYPTFQKHHPRQLAKALCLLPAKLLYFCFRVSGKATDIFCYLGSVISVGFIFPKPVLFIYVSTCIKWCSVDIYLASNLVLQRYKHDHKRTLFSSMVSLSSFIFSVIAMRVSWSPSRFDINVSRCDSNWRWKSRISSSCCSF